MAGDITRLLPSTKRRVEAVLVDPRLTRVRGGVYVTSGCRSRALQERLRWLYLHVPGSPLAAVPGTSPHEIGAKVPDYCIAADLGFRNGNPPYGNISNRPSWVARHPDWALLERVCNDHGLIRTVRSEEWHYQESGSPPLVIAPPPPEEFMAVATQADLTSLKAGVLYAASAHHQLTVARKEADGSNPTVLLRLNRLDKLCRALLEELRAQGADVEAILARVVEDEETGPSFESALRAATVLEPDSNEPPPG